MSNTLTKAEVIGAVYNNIDRMFVSNYFERFVLLLFLSLIVSSLGCASTYRMTTSFEPKDFGSDIEKGDAVITGTAFLQKRYIRQYAKDVEIILTPATAYSEELMKAIAEHPVQVVNLDPLLAQYQRVTHTDKNGRFRFEGIASGDYFLHCFIVYSLPGSLSAMGRAASSRSATSLGRVKVRQGDVVYVEVRADLPYVY